MSKGKGKYQLELDKILGKEPRFVVYYPILGKILESAKAGLFLGQMVYWYDKGDDPEWIYKTVKETKDELCLSRKEQDTAISKCERLGFLEVKVEGLPPKRHFKLNMDVIFAAVKDAIKTAAPGSNNEQASESQPPGNSNPNPIDPNKVASEEAIDKVIKVFELTINAAIDYKGKKNREAAKYLIQKFGLKRTLNEAGYACDIQSKKFAPVVASPYQLKEKFGEIEAYYQRNSQRSFWS